MNEEQPNQTTGNTEHSEETSLTSATPETSTEQSVTPVPSLVQSERPALGDATTNDAEKVAPADPENQPKSKEEIKADLTKKASEQQWDYIELTKITLGTFTDPISQQPRELTLIGFNEQKYRIPVAERPAILAKAQELLAKYLKGNQDLENVTSEVKAFVEEQNPGADQNTIENEMAEIMPGFNYRKEMFRMDIDSLGRAIEALKNSYDAMEYIDLKVDTLLTSIELLSQPENKNLMKEKLDSGNPEFDHAMFELQQALIKFATLMNVEE